MRRMICFLPVARRKDAGYALLMVIFMVASMILVAAVVTPRLLTEGRREKEAELVWRGKQYVRAVKLFYQKNGRYPQTLEELSKPSQTGAHYLRKSYKDPTNAADGKWRLIYVSPSGQLIGSVNYLSLQDMALKLGLGISTAGSGANPLVPQTGSPADPSQSGAANANAVAQQGSSQGGAAQNGQSAPSGLSQLAQAGQTNPTGQPGQNSSPFASSFGQPTPVGQLQAVDGPVLGGSVIGVGSKVKKDSLQIYQGADTYAKWEFIFNPLSTANTAGQATTVIGGAPGGAQGATGAGAGIGGFGLPGSAAAGAGGPGSGPTQNPAPTPTQSNPQQ